MKLVRSSIDLSYAITRALRPTFHFVWRLLRRRVSHVGAMSRVHRSAFAHSLAGMLTPIPWLKVVANRVRFPVGVNPLSQAWGDRGLPLHRHYVEQFFQEFSGDIHGDCLEFQEDTYTSRFGQSFVRKLDIVHKERGNPHATVVVDLTEPNELPGNTYDCIICTYTLHAVFDFNKMIAELYRLLKNNGTLFVAVPHLLLCYPQYHELWRFTPEGLEAILVRTFGKSNVLIRAYGNSLTTAGELRGLVARDFTRTELEHHDPRFAMVLMARAAKHYYAD